MEAAKQKEKALDKVRKLMAVSKENGATEGEIENAHKAAQKIMMQHAIEEGDIFMCEEDIDEQIVNNNYKGNESNTWVWELLDIIAKNYNCRILRSGFEKHYFYRIIGLKSDRIVVKEMLEMTIEMIRNLYAKRWKEGSKRTSRGIFVRSYISGFMFGLNQKLLANKKIILTLPAERATYELIVIKVDDLINDWVDRNLKKPKTVKHRDIEKDAEAFLNGFDDGKENSTTKQIHQ